MAYAKTVGSLDLYNLAKRNGVAMRTLSKYGALSNINSGLAVWWKFDESSGTTAADSSGNGKPGTLTNMAGTEWATGGKLKNCLTFDTNDYVVNTSIGTLSGACTAAIWVKRNGVAGVGLRLFDLARAADIGLNTIIDATTGQAVLDNDGGCLDSLIGGANICDNAWHHVVVTRSGSLPSVFKLYVDGSLIATSNNAGNTLPTLTRFFVGRRSDGVAPFSGQLDDVRVYNRELSAADVAALYLVTAPGSIAVGSATVFESAATDDISVCMMDATHAIVCYRDIGNSNYGTACCLTLTGTTITAGAPVVFESANATNIEVCMLDTTHAIVCYTDNGNSNYGTACCLTLSGDVITAETPVVFRSASTSNISVCAMDATHAIVGYRDGGNAFYGTARCLTLSGTAITAEAPVVFESASTLNVFVCAMDATHAIVCYRDVGNSSYGTACCLTLNGTTITPGTPVVFESAATTSISVCAMSPASAIVCYRDGGNSGYGTACHLALSGDVISAGTPTVYETASTIYNSVGRMDASRAIVSYQNGSSLYGMSRCLNLSGTTISVDEAATFDNGFIEHISLCAMDPRHAIVCYRDVSALSHGKSRCLTLS